MVTYKNISYEQTEKNIIETFNNEVLSHNSEALRSVYEKWYTEVSKQINYETNLLCTKYNIPAEKLRLTSPDQSCKFINSILDELRVSGDLSEMLAAVVGFGVALGPGAAAIIAEGTYTTTQVTISTGTGYAIIPLASAITLPWWPILLPAAIAGGVGVGLGTHKLAKEPLEKWLKKGSPPVWLKRLAYDQKGFEDTVNKKILPQVRSVINDSLGQSITAEKVLLLTKPLMEQLSKSADIVALLVK